MKMTASITGLIAVAAMFVAGTASAQQPSQAAATDGSSEKVRENPAAQYLLVKTVVAQASGLLDARAKPLEPEGYNLLKYCWTAENVLGDWAERAGTTGAMVVRALETRSWQRDLARAGYPEAPIAEATGRYEAALVAAGFTEAARARALDALVSDLDAVRRSSPGAAPVRTVGRCDGERRSLGLNFTTVPPNGRARFIPYVLHQICEAQQLNPDDLVRCDYWLYGKNNGPMSFAGETVYSVRWLDSSTANGRFDPEQLRSTGTVTLRLKVPKATK
jgi:hypothetical protein